MQRLCGDMSTMSSGLRASKLRANRHRGWYQSACIGIGYGQHSTMNKECILFLNGQQCTCTSRVPAVLHTCMLKRDSAIRSGSPAYYELGSL